MKIVYPNINCPCKDCTDRHIACHCECEKYKEFKENREQINQEIRKKAEQENSLISYERQRVERIMGKKEAIRNDYI